MSSTEDARDDQAQDGRTADDGFIEPPVHRSTYTPPTNPPVPAPEPAAVDDDELANALAADLSTLTGSMPVIYSLDDPTGTPIPDEDPFSGLFAPKPPVEPDIPAYEVPPAPAAPVYEVPPYVEPTFEAPSYVPPPVFNEQPAAPPAWEAPAWEAPAWEAPAAEQPSTPEEPYRAAPPPWEPPPPPASSAFEMPAAPTGFPPPAFGAPPTQPPVFEAPAAPLDEPTFTPSSFEAPAAFPPPPFPRQTEPGQPFVMPSAAEQAASLANLSAPAGPPWIPQRRSMSDEELMSALEIANGPQGTNSMLQELQDQLRMREEEAQEYRDWEQSMLDIGSPEALAAVDKVRPQFTGIVPPAPTDAPEPVAPQPPAAEPVQNWQPEDFTAPPQVPDAPAPAEQAPSYSAPVEDAPVYEAPAAETPVYEVPVADAPVYEVPVADAPVYETPAAETPVHEVPVEQEPAAEIPATDPFDFSAAPASPIEETVPAAPFDFFNQADPVPTAPVYEIPVEEAPAAEAPAAEAPVWEAPAAEAPVYEIPVDESPAAEAPAAEAPAWEAPAAEAPVYEIPVDESPAAGTPAWEAPAAEAPVFEIPVEESLAAGTPAWGAPAAEAPAAEAPVYEIPVEEAPAAEPAAWEAPAAEAPVYDIPVEESPAAEVPDWEAPAAEAPVYDIPVEESPAAEVPAWGAPAAETPAAESPAEPAAEAPVWEMPAAPVAEAPAGEAPAAATAAWEAPSAETPLAENPIDPPAADPFDFSAAPAAPIEETVPAAPFDFFNQPEPVAEAPVEPTMAEQPSEPQPASWEQQEQQPPFAPPVLVPSESEQTPAAPEQFTPEPAQPESAPADPFASFFATTPPAAESSPEPTPWSPEPAPEPTSWSLDTAQPEPDLPVSPEPTQWSPETVSPEPEPEPADPLASLFATPPPVAEPIREPEPAPADPFASFYAATSTEPAPVERTEQPKQPEQPVQPEQPGQPVDANPWAEPTIPPPFSPPTLVEPPAAPEPGLPDPWYMTPPPADDAPPVVETPPADVPGPSAEAVADFYAAIAADDSTPFTVDGPQTTAPAPAPQGEYPTAPPPGYDFTTPSSSAPAAADDASTPSEAAPVAPLNFDDLLSGGDPAAPVAAEPRPLPDSADSSAGVRRSPEAEAAGFDGDEELDGIDESDRAFGELFGAAAVATTLEPVASGPVVSEPEVIEATIDEPVTVEEPAVVAPVAPKVFAVEQVGPEPTPLDQRVGRAARSFWLWFAANSSVVSIAFGAIIFSLGMSPRQAIISALVGVALSFIPLGLGTLAGKRSGQPTMVISRATFGVRGNVVPAVLALVTRIFWGAALLWLLASSVAAILVGAEADGGLGATVVTLIGLGVGLVLAAVIAYFGYALIVWLQLVTSVVSGLLIVGLILLTWPAIDVATIRTIGDGSWLLVVTGAVLVFSFVGLVWANSSADLARYQNPASSGPAASLWASFGTAIPTFLLITYGALLAASNEQFANGLLENPLDTLGRLLPVWYPIPLIAATALGLLSAVVVSLYSGSFALQSVGVRLARPAGTIVIAVLLGAIAVGLSLLSLDLTGLFRDVATTLAVPVAAWVGIFGAEVMIRQRRFDARSLLATGGVYPTVHWVNLPALFVITGLGLGLTTATVAGLTWQGYLFPLLGVPLDSVLATSDLGVFAALLLGLLVPIVAGIPGIRRQESAQAQRN